MVEFSKVIQKKNIIVNIESKLYFSYNEVFDAIFNAFVSSEKEIKEMQNSLIVVKNREMLRKKFRFLHFCNTRKRDWVFHLINALEIYYAQVLDCSALHCSCIRAFDKNILIVGKRKSGKTTLVKFFIDNFNAVYMADDCVYIDNGYYFGFSLPIPMRHLLYPKGDLLCTTFDDEKKPRNLFNIANKFNETKNIDFVLFPQYKYDIENFSCNRIANDELFNNLMANVRNFKSNYLLYKDIFILIKNTEAYRLAYNNCNDVVEWLCNYINIF